MGNKTNGDNGTYVYPAGDAVSGPRRSTPSGGQGNGTESEGDVKCVKECCSSYIYMQRKIDR